MQTDQHQAIIEFVETNPPSDSRSEAQALVGRVLGDTYRLERVLGSGGMGVVYEASHTRIQRRFAVKVLHVKRCEDPEAMARFKREAMIGSRLGHDHIAKVVDFVASGDDFPYIVMELLEGESLHDLLRREGQLPLARAASIVRQVALALASAHAEGVVHRDLKPDNIFVCTQQGGGEVAKVMDFGISKVLASQSIVTQQAAVLGTPTYMAPEQAQGRVDQIDSRTDVFALAVLFYQMLGGRRPFLGDHLSSILYQVIHCDPTPLESLRQDVPAGVVSAIARAMDKRIEQRQASAGELISEVQHAMGAQWQQVLMHQVICSSTTPAPSLAEVGVAGFQTTAGLVLDTINSSGEDHASAVAQLVLAETMNSHQAPVGPVALPGFVDHDTLVRCTGELDQAPASSPRLGRGARLGLISAACVMLAGVAVTAVAYVSGPAGEHERAAAPVAASRPAVARPATRMPASPAPAAVTSRVLTITSTPPGARIRIDGKRSGKTPVVLLVPVDQRLKVTARRAGHRGVARKVEPGQAAVQLKLRLRARPATLGLTTLHGSRNAVAMVYLDGRRIDQTPLEIPRLKPGRHSLRIESKDFRTVRQQITLRPGQNKQLVVRLTR